MDKIKSRKRALILSVIVCVLSFLLLTILENTMKPAIDESKDSDKIAITEEFGIQCAYNSSLRKYVTTITGKIKNLTKSSLDNLILIFSVEASGIPYQYEREALSIGTENELRVQTAFQSSEPFRKLRGVQARFGDNPPFTVKNYEELLSGKPLILILNVIVAVSFVLLIVYAVLYGKMVSKKEKREEQRIQAQLRASETCAVCEYCGGKNSRDAGKCKFCGAPIDS